MKIIFFSSNLELLTEWGKKLEVQGTVSFYDLNELQTFMQDTEEEYLIVADYDTMATEINKMIASNTVPPYLIVLEKIPELITGKMLIFQKIKAYGNSRILKGHFQQMIETVKNKKIWTYPELTAILAKNEKNSALTKEATELIEHRLSQKEKDVLYLILKSLTNSAIASELGITQRTVKAHVSSIFSKLHVNDRVSLILLLK